MFHTVSYTCNVFFEATNNADDVGGSGDGADDVTRECVGEYLLKLLIGPRFGVLGTGSVKGAAATTSSHTPTPLC